MKLSTSYDDFIKESNLLKNKLNDKEKELESIKNQFNITTLNSDQFSQGNNGLKKKIIELEKINKSLNDKLFKEKGLGFEGDELNINYKNEIEEKNKKIRQLE